MPRKRDDKLAEYWVVLILIAAFAHAAWNLMLKRSKNKRIFLWAQRLWAVIVFLPIAVISPASIPFSWQWIFWGLGSTLLHAIYSLLLVKMYNKSAFSFAYPIARGTGPLLVVIAGWSILGEKISFLQLTGVLSIILGIQLIYAQAGPVFRKTTIKAIMNNPWSLLVGVSTASYTIFDKIAVAHLPALWLSVLENIGQVIVLGVIIWRENRAEIPVQWRADWRKMALAGFLVGLAYLLVLQVLTVIPVSYVSPVRESSILISALLGSILLKEKLGLHNLLGAFLIFCGVVFIVT